MYGVICLFKNSSYSDLDTHYLQCEQLVPFDLLVNNKTSYRLFWQ